MKKGDFRRTLTVLICAAALLSLSAVILRGMSLKYMKTFTVTDGEYYVLSANVTPTGRNSGEYAVTSETLTTSDGSLKGLGYRVRDVRSSASETDCLWLIEKKENGYTFFSADQQKYLNLDSKNAFLSNTPQVLTIEISGGKAKISRQINGKTVYLRFTNTNDLPRWHAGTTSSSNAFQLYLYGEPDTEGYDNSGEDPLYTVACFSDLHVDYGIQSRSVPIRQSTIIAAQKIRDMGGADVVLVGGDMTSANNRTAPWSDEIIDKVQQTIYDTLAPVAKDGKVLFVSGNHDSQASVQAQGELDSNNYTRFMEPTCGAYVDPLYRDIDGVHSLLCYRYSFAPVEYVVINTPYNSEINATSAIFNEQATWMAKQLRDIGKEKTVIVLCHYPLSSIGTRDPEKGDAQQRMIAALKNYPNVIYCYGHVHGDDEKYSWYNTGELVLSDGFLSVGPNTVSSSSYITSHMGSMGYYNNQFQPGGLTADDPMIAQVMMIYFYRDHITFRMINTGEQSGDAEVYEIGSLTVMRDLSAQFSVREPEQEPTTATASDNETAATVTDSTAPENEKKSSAAVGIGAGTATVVLLCAGGSFALLKKKKRSAAAKQEKTDN